MADKVIREVKRGDSPFELQEYQHPKPCQWEEDGLTVTRTTVWTAPGCHEGCGVLVYADKDGNFVKIEGDADDPFNRGRLCPRCFCIDEVLNHPDRVVYPMKRDKSKRGDGNAWERCSWDEALDICADAFKKIAEEYGPETIHVQRGTGRDIMWQAGRLAYGLGSPTEYGAMSGQSCYCPRLSQMILTLGGQLIPDYASHFPDRYDNPAYEAPNCVMVWGCDPLYSNPDFQMGHWVTDAMKLGAKLIVVDPRLTWLASRAEVHLGLRPGTDGALALGMANVMIEENLYDHEFVEKWVHGFDEFKERVAEFPVEKVAKICWLDPEDIRKAARLFAEKKPSNCFWGVAVDMQNGGIATAQAIESLFILTGNIDNPGGMVFTQRPFSISQNMGGGWGIEKLPTEIQEARPGFREYPLFRFGFTAGSPDAALEYAEKGELHGLVIQTTNTLTGMGDEPERWYEQMKKVDFCLGIDIFMNATIQALGDVFLPAACWPEKKSIRAYYFYASTINPSVKPRGEVKSDAEIGRLLGQRMGGDMWPWPDEEAIYDEILAPTGFTYKSLQENGPAYPTYEYYKYEKGMMRPDGQPGFMTPTGKLELYSTMFESFGLDPMPTFTEPSLSPESTPELYEEYPLVLMTGARSKVFFHTEHRQIPHLRQFHKWPTVQISPEYAAKHGIEDGDWVYIENPRGKCRQKAEVTDMVAPNMALGQHGWWFPEETGTDKGSAPYLFGTWDVNINNLLINAPSVAGFGADIKCVLCKIYKVPEDEVLPGR